MHSKYSMGIGGQHTFFVNFLCLFISNNNDQKKRTHVLALCSHHQERGMYHILPLSHHHHQHCQLKLRQFKHKQMKQVKVHG